MGVWFTLIFQWYGLSNVTNIVVIDRGKIQDDYIHNENKVYDYAYPQGYPDPVISIFE